MRNSYYRRPSPLLSSPTRVAAFAVVIVLILLFILRYALPGIFFAAAAPVFSLGTALPAASGFVADSFGDAAALSLRVRTLESENAALVNQNTALRERITEFEGLAKDAMPRGVAAGVIARPPLAPYDVLIAALPVGVSVAQGSLVSAQGGVPVGTVETIAGGYVHVSFLSSPGRTTDAWIGEERLPLTLTGKGGGAFTAEIARDAGVAVGDSVYVAGAGTRMVGSVARIDSDPSSPTSKMFIAPLVNLFTVTMVLIEDLP